MNEKIIANANVFNYDYTEWREANDVALPELSDGRLTAIRYSNTEFTMKRYRELAEWEKRKKEIREKILISAGLWPMPEKTPLNPVISVKMGFDDIIIQNVVLESFPGFYITGNLFTPLNPPKNPMPAVIHCHGHGWSARYNKDDCKNFAKMGMVAFAHDMVGYGDSTQITHWYGGIKNDLWCANSFGIHLWNNIRVVDFLSSLEYVDKERIATVGASGGGTQVMMHAAVDDRIKAASPMAMMSAHYQGGCGCENACLLRTDTNNMEITAAIAPKPMLIVSSDGDWTKNTPYYEYPTIREIYGLYNAGHLVEYYYQEAEHNWNQNSREAVYHWIYRKFIGIDEFWHERYTDIGDLEKIKTPLPGFLPEERRKIFINSESGLLKKQKERRKEAVAALSPAGNPEEKAILKTGLRHVLMDSIPIPKEITRKEVDIEAEGVNISQILVSNEGGIGRIPACVITKKLNGECVSQNKLLFILHPKGKTGLLKDKRWTRFIDDALNKGYAIGSADLFLQGENSRPGIASGRNPMLSTHFYCFNRTDDALRVSDIVTVYEYFKTKGFDDISIVGLDTSARNVMSAIPFLENIKRGIVDLSQLDLEEDDYIDSFYLPGFLSVGGFETCIKLYGDMELVAFNGMEKTMAETIKIIYESANKSDKLKIYTDEPESFI